MSIAEVGNVAREITARIGCASGKSKRGGGRPFETFVASHRYKRPKPYYLPKSAQEWGQVVGGRVVLCQCKLLHM
jgi:hypothetical protein